VVLSLRRAKHSGSSFAVVNHYNITMSGEHPFAADRTGESGNGVALSSSVG
jgi:hypothetical protein